MNESKLQQKCFMWHHNTFPNERKRLYMNYNNPPNKIKGAQLKGMGLVAGVADMSYLSAKGIVFIELKTETGTQSKEQLSFELIVSSLGYPYHIIRTLEEFQELIKKYQS